MNAGLDAIIDVRVVVIRHVASRPDVDAHRLMTSGMLWFRCSSTRIRNHEAARSAHGQRQTPRRKHRPHSDVAIRQTDV